MCDNGEFELDYHLECELCGKKPAVDLSDPTTGESDLGYTFLCEKCGIERLSEAVVSEWAGTELYLKKYPDQVEVWR